jgi:hypothetical protein
VRKAARQNTKRLSATLKRLKIEVYGHGLTRRAQGRFNGPYRCVTKAGTSSRISETLVCRPIGLLGYSISNLLEVPEDAGGE